ncbi:MAG TPA: hypothetical protein V6D08_18610 [Candidatus Obscuribacterales bacterium]
MAENKEKKSNGLSMPLVGMLILGGLGAIVSAASFEVIKHYPEPVSVVPYFGPDIGFIWGAVVGVIVGGIIGYLVDDNHFEETKY